MCMGGDFGKQLFNPFAGAVPGDPISSQIVEKAAPAPVKQLATLPQRAIGGIIGQDNASTLVKAGDPRGLLNQGQDWNSPEANRQAKSLLGS